MARHGIEALRVAIRALDERGVEEKQVVRYDMVFNDNPQVTSLTDEEVADIFAECTRDTVRAYLEQGGN